MDNDDYDDNNDNDCKLFFYYEYLALVTMPLLYINKYFTAPCTPLLVLKIKLEFITF